MDAKLFEGGVEIGVICTNSPADDVPLTLPEDHLNTEDGIIQIYQNKPSPPP